MEFYQDNIIEPTIVDSLLQCDRDTLSNYINQLPEIKDNSIEYYEIFLAIILCSIIKNDYLELLDRIPNLRLAEIMYKDIVVKFTIDNDGNNTPEILDKLCIDNKINKYITHAVAKDKIQTVKHLLKKIMDVNDIYEYAINAMHSNSLNTFHYMIENYPILSDQIENILDKLVILRHNAAHFINRLLTIPPRAKYMKIILDKLSLECVINTYYKIEPDLFEILKEDMENFVVDYPMVYMISAISNNDFIFLQKVFEAGANLSVEKDIDAVYRKCLLMNNLDTVFLNYIIERCSPTDFSKILATLLILPDLEKKTIIFRMLIKYGMNLDKITETLYYNILLTFDFEFLSEIKLDELIDNKLLLGYAVNTVNVPYMNFLIDKGIELDESYGDRFGVFFINFACRQKYDDLIFYLDKYHQYLTPKIASSLIDVLSYETESLQYKKDDTSNMDKILRIINLLIQKGANLDLLFDEDQKIRFSKLHLEIIKMFINNGLDCKKYSTKIIPMAQDFESVVYLVKEGVDISALRNFSFDFVLEAIDLEKLMEIGYSIFDNLDYIIEDAIDNEKICIIVYLIDFGYEIPSKYNNTCIIKWIKTYLDRRHQQSDLVIDYQEYYAYEETINYNAFHYRGTEAKLYSIIRSFNLR